MHRSPGVIILAVPSAVRRQGSLDGELIRVGGKDRHRVRVMLQSEDHAFGHIHAKKSLAKELGNHLFEPVRLFGSGRWRRDPVGVWTLRLVLIFLFW